MGAHDEIGFDFTTSEGWDSIYASDESGPGPDPFVLNEIFGLSPGRALDLGCGSGANAIALAAAGWSVTGVDWSPRAIEIARRVAAESGVNVELEVGDVTSWATPDVFDLVLSSYALPTGRQREAIATAVSALAAGGTLLVLELDPEMNAQWAADDDEAITPETIVAELAGLVVERAEVVEIDRGDHDAAGHEHGISVVVRASKPSG